MQKSIKKRRKSKKFYQISFIDCKVTVELEAVSKQAAIRQAKKHLIEGLLIDNYKKIEVD